MELTAGVFWNTGQQVPKSGGGVFWKTNQETETVSKPWQESDWKPTQKEMKGFYDRLKNGLVLKQGSQGLEVALLQYRLKQFLEQRNIDQKNRQQRTLGLTQIQVDGKFGPGTESVVRAFQRFINQTVSCDGLQACLVEDGIVNKNIVLHLENAFPRPR